MTKFAGAVWATLRCKRNAALKQTEGQYIMATQLKQPPHGSPAWFHACVERASSKPLMETVMLTPSLANEMIKQNPDNRNIRTTKVVQYAADMRDGRWVFNGEPIIISKDGKLNDGQHRCTAVIDANAAIEVPVIFGIDRETRTTVDQGAARIAADYLGMEGRENASILASSARLLIAYRNGAAQSLKNSNHISNGEIMELARADEGLPYSAKFAQHLNPHGGRFAAVSIIAFCHYVLGRISAPDADTYLTQVCLGENLKRSDPAFVVRERLLAFGRGQRDDKIEIIFRGWNAFRRKANPRTLQNLKVLPALV